MVEPEDGILAIGSGGSYALAAARALLAHSTLDAEEHRRESMKIAGDIDIYTNQQITIEELTREGNSLMTTRTIPGAARMSTV